MESDDLYGRNPAGDLHELSLSVEVQVPFVDLWLMGVAGQLHPILLTKVWEELAHDLVLECFEVPRVTSGSNHEAEIFVDPNRYVRVRFRGGSKPDRPTVDGVSPANDSVEEPL